MRFSILILALSSLLLLANCSQRDMEVMKSEFKAEKPRGYRREKAPPPVVIGGETQAAMQQQAKTQEAEGELAWNEIGAYDAVRPSLPGRVAPAGKVSVPIVYEDVTVFPVDGDYEPYEDMTYDFDRPVPLISHAGGASLLPARAAQQVFFAYGSARVVEPERQKLKKLAAGVSRAASECKVDVVGHASKRVDNVPDPVRRKMINFVMAQKRASAVAQELFAAGVAPDCVTVSSRGDEAPNLNPGSLGQEAADRRADVYVGPGQAGR